jgi:signal peptidase II
MRWGYVIDFLDVHWHWLSPVGLWHYEFPKFNIADSLICLGVFLLMIDGIRYPQPSGLLQRFKDWKKSP